MDIHFREKVTVTGFITPNRVSHNPDEPEPKMIKR